MAFVTGDKVRLLAGARPSGSTLVGYKDSEGLFRALDDAGVSSAELFRVISGADMDGDVEITPVDQAVTELFYTLSQYLVRDYELDGEGEEFVGKIWRANEYVGVDAEMMTKVLNLARELK